MGIPAGFCCSWFALISTPAAIGTGVFALMNISKDPERQKGKELAIVGIVAGLLLPAMLVVFVFVGVAMLGIGGLR